MIFLINLVTVGLAVRRIGFKKRADRVVRPDVVAVHPGRPVLPVEAIQVSGGKQFVFVVDADQVHRREVKTGVDAGDWLEVVDGVKAGETVVVAGIEGLSEGSKVRVAKASVSYMLRTGDLPEPT